MEVVSLQCSSLQPRSWRRLRSVEGLAENPEIIETDDENQF